MDELPPLEHEYETVNRRGMARWIAGCTDIRRPPPEPTDGEGISWSQAWSTLMTSLHDEISDCRDPVRRAELLAAHDQLVAAPARQPFAVQTSCCSSASHDYRIAWWIAPA